MMMTYVWLRVTGHLIPRTSARQKSPSWTSASLLRVAVYLYLYLYVDGLEGVSLEYPHPHQNVVSIDETSASNIYPVYS